MFIQSDLFEKVEGSFDLIVSNPPYIRSQEIAGLMPEVREHEPHLALDGKDDGLHFYREIIKGAMPHLKRGGQLFLKSVMTRERLYKHFLRQTDIQR